MPIGYNLRLSTADRRDNDPIALRLNKKGSRILQNNNTIEILNTTNLLIKDPHSLFSILILNLNGTEEDPRDRVLCYLFKLIVTKASRYFK